jgi:hypothetical protein
MRSGFREWYPPTPEELQRLWTDAVIVLDSNVLLGLYQYPPSALEEFLSVLEAVRERLWLPHQAALEFHRNRELRIPEQWQVLDRISREIENLSSSLDSLGLPEFHPTLEMDEFEARRQDVREALEALADHVRAAREKTPELTALEILTRDPLFDRITSIFEDRVGEPFSAEDLRQCCREGESRYAAEIPPGFKDREKDQRVRYNDVVIWKQTLRMSTSAEPDARRPAIFVTNDRKDDWWRRRHGAILGPRTELIREYMDEVGQDFHMYTPSGFLEAARQHLEVDVSRETIDDVRRISSESRASSRLRGQRRVLPEAGTRIASLHALYAAFARGEVRRVEDVNVIIHGLDGEFDSGYVATPLFFSLINQAYGPIEVDPDPSTRLRDRSVVGLRNSESREAFVASAHAAWLAQALYRIRLDGLADDELLVGFFGEDYGAHEIQLLDKARELVALDLEQRAA